MVKRGRGGGHGRTGGSSPVPSDHTPESSTMSVSTPESVDPTPLDTPDPNSPVTFAAIDALLTKHFKHTLDSLNASINAVTLVANNALALVEKLEVRIKALEDANKELKAKAEKNSAENTAIYKKIETNHSEVIMRVGELEEKLEERTNCQLRKTLVFRGIEAWR